MPILKQIREQQNLTQEELSEKSGISVRTIQRIEAGTPPKGHTLKTLAKTLQVHEGAFSEEPSAPIIEETIDYTKVKLINLCSILFVILPPLNILVPLLISHFLKQKNQLIKQIITVQILWTILAPIIFMLGIFLKLGRQFTLVLMITIILSNVIIILLNTAQIDRRKQLLIKPNFSIL